MPVKCAICYDFDGTLIRGAMQEYGLIQAFGITPEKFWKMKASFAERNNCDSTLAYLYCFAALAGKQSHEKKRLLSESSLRSFGEKLTYFNGVKDWFQSVNKAGTEKDIEVEHYIISSGFQSIIEGSSIAGEISRIFACRYIYDDEGVPVFPSLVVDSASKIEYLVRISKQAFESGSDYNAKIPKGERPIPLQNICYIGDGLTDIPSMAFTKHYGGLSCAVYDPENERVKEIGLRLKNERRVSHCVPADYTKNGKLFQVISIFLERIKERKTEDCFIER